MHAVLCIGEVGRALEMPNTLEMPQPIHFGHAAAHTLLAITDPSPSPFMPPILTGQGSVYTTKGVDTRGNGEPISVPPRYLIPVTPRRSNLYYHYRLQGSITIIACRVRLPLSPAGFDDAHFWFPQRTGPREAQGADSHSRPCPDPTLQQ